MKLFRVIVPVRDIEAASTFYGEVFSSPGERVGENRHYFDGNGCVFACVEPRGRPFAPNPDVLYLSTDEPLEALRETWVGGGGTIDDDIRDRDWGETSFYGRDPYGNQLCFVVAGTEFTGGRFVE